MVIDPSHAFAAVKTVFDMHLAVAELNRQLTLEGLPQLVIRAGISTGEMVVGDAGSAEASDYTVLGDCVNFASRLESANKQLGTKFLISERTRDLTKERFLMRAIGRMRVVGKQQANQVFEPMCEYPTATQDQRNFVACTQTMVEAFVRNDFDACRDGATALIRRDADDKLAGFYLKLCIEIIERRILAPLDGVITLAEK